jgi:prostaglandin-endoperoxide synthase 2
MAVEFNLLYRWHSMVPSAFRIDGQDVPIGSTLFNNELVTRRGLGPLFEDATDQPACRVGLFNTHPYLREAEIESLRQAREVRLASYNDYRELCRFPRVTNVDQISSDQRVRAGLRELYGHVDEIEFFVGLFAEDRRPNSVLPSLIGRMVGIDAFSQAFTNPLLAPRVYNAATFSSLGLDVIRTTRRLSDIVHRNLPDRNRRYRVSMTRSDWTRV